MKLGLFLQPYTRVCWVTGPGMNSLALQSGLTLSESPARLSKLCQSPTQAKDEGASFCYDYGVASSGGSSWGLECFTWKEALEGNEAYICFWPLHV